MRVKVKVPRLGLTVEDAIVMEWHKKVGDSVEAGEVIGVIEADKATVELESPASGTVTEIIGEIGETYEVGEPLAVLEV
ncbi:MAG: biotin attachment protein [Rhodospirillaceae bacterium]|jgi:pyruvate dehydrogenase E2 component (dihydrolipoamide acetyltransferase)|nr:biotin attachment protein [Rhodospirillaceae bacterium]MBT4426963.1 biotin attachment protein [Rhodospirillaceae bacterium]MBT5038610.1 biotin attachment protein [Rhodospirillaceae bacterium]MBT5677317.1 biotin attachment protein [Rhodospirillaceae bacterium]MBT5778639.1 biotin attachment protein [Rhodospirillaceae bacterium]